MNVDSVILNKQTKNQNKNNQYGKNNNNHDQMVFIPGIQGWFYIQNSM